MGKHHHRKKKPKFSETESLIMTERNLKKKQIKSAIDDGDIAKLAILACTNGGLMNNYLRNLAWPMLLDISSFQYCKDPQCKSKEDTIKEFNMDVKRSFYHFTCCLNYDESELEKKRHALSDLMSDVLRADTSLHYFQGFHDICTVALLTMDTPERARAVVLRLSHLYFYDHHQPSFQTTVQVLKLIADIIKTVDKPVYEKMEQCGVSNGIYAISWVITAFAHELEDISTLLVIYDAILANHPAFILYLCAAYVLRDECRDQLLHVEDENMPMMHQYLQKLPPPILSNFFPVVKRKKKKWKKSNRITQSPETQDDTTHVSNLITTALRMMASFPPENLLEKKEIPRTSSLFRSMDTMISWESSFSNASTFVRSLNRRRKLFSAYFIATTIAGIVAYTWVANNEQHLHP